MRKIVIAAGVLLLTLGGVALFRGGDRFADLYAALQTEPLPASLQNSPGILPLLERLQKNQCDDRVANDLAAALIAASDKRAAAGILAGVSGRCPGSDGMMYKAADYYLSLADYADARKVSDRLIASSPSDPRFRSQAGQIDMGLGLTAEAVTQFEAAIEKAGDRRALDRSVFFDLATAQAKLGQFCKAAAVLQQWVALDPPQRDDYTSQKPIADYLVQGNCVQ